MEREARYFLKTDWTPYVEVTKEQWVRAERGSGFRPKGVDRGQPATAGFGSSNGTSGTVVYSWTEEAIERWAEHSPELAAILRG